MTTKHKQLRDVIVEGDVFQIAKGFPKDSVRCVVTSPPYFGHRDYSGDRSLAKVELGKESDPKQYIHRLVSLFSDLKDVLCEDGTIWLNLGDTYRDGQLIGIPWRVALGLQESGWMLRSEIIWEKPNAMPSSIKSRPTISHEHVFLFAKSESYFYNADAIREPHITFSPQSKMKGGRNHFGKRNGTPEKGKNKGSHNLHDARWDQYFHPLGRNKRTVWSIALGKCREAHFAVFPEKLVETCLSAATRRGDTVLDPFMGSGTTGLVAKKMGRHFVGVELIPEYIAMANKRIHDADSNETLFSYLEDQQSATGS